MKLETSVKDLHRIIMVLILMVCLLGAYTVYKDVRHDAAIKIAAITNTLQIYDQNFGAIKNSLENIEGRLQRTELAQQIQGNIVESGAVDDQGQPVKK